MRRMIEQRMLIRAALRSRTDELDSICEYIETNQSAQVKEMASI